MQEAKDLKKTIFGWRPRNFLQHLIFNLVLIGIVAFIIIWILLIWLDNWTDHGHYVVIPEVKGMQYNEAYNKLTSEGFTVELSDSIFDSKTRPGTIIEQNPKQGTKVKDGRMVYLTINAFSPKTVSVPSLTDVSLRQARSILEGLGIRNISVKYIPSEYKDLVMGVKKDGLTLKPGSRIPVTSSVVLEVGEGYFETDSVAGDSDTDLLN